MKRFKFISVILVFVCCLALVLAGCGDNTNLPNEAEGGNDADITIEGNVLIAASAFYARLCRSKQQNASLARSCVLA